MEKSGHSGQALLSHKGKGSRSKAVHVMATVPPPCPHLLPDIALDITKHCITCVMLLTAAPSCTCNAALALQVCGFVLCSNLVLVSIHFRRYSENVLKD